MGGAILLENRQKRFIREKRHHSRKCTPFIENASPFIENASPLIENASPFIEDASQL